MSYASRHFQSVGARNAKLPDAQRTAEHERIATLLYSHGNLHRAYLRSLVGGLLPPRRRPPSLRVYVNPQPDPSVAVAPRYRVGNTFRPKRANQHSRNIVVTGIDTDGRIHFNQGGKSSSAWTPEAFEALIGRKVE